MAGRQARTEQATGHRGDHRVPARNTTDVLRPDRRVGLGRTPARVPHVPRRAAPPGPSTTQSHGRRRRSEAAAVRPSRPADAGSGSPSRCCCGPGCGSASSPGWALTRSSTSAPDHGCTCRSASSAMSALSRSTITVITADQVGPERLLGGVQGCQPHSLTNRASAGPGWSTQRSTAPAGPGDAAAGPKSHRPVPARSSAAARSAWRSARRPSHRSCRTSDPPNTAPSTSSTSARTRTASTGPWPAGPSTRHRCPVGSRETVAPANPPPSRRSAAQSNTVPRSQVRQRNVRRANTFES